MKPEGPQCQPLQLQLQQPPALKQLQLQPMSAATQGPVMHFGVNICWDTVQPVILELHAATSPAHLPTAKQQSRGRYSERRLASEAKSVHRRGLACSLG